MFGLDDLLAELAHGETLVVVLAVALLLGLRHASDPDHLAAVTTLIATDPEDGSHQATRLGLAWGMGHALTLAAFGLPIVLFHSYLPETAQRVAEALVGLLIIFLAVRLLSDGARGTSTSTPIATAASSTGTCIPTTPSPTTTRTSRTRGSAARRSRPSASA